jgi:hypothetical protein
LIAETKMATQDGVIERFIVGEVSLVFEITFIQVMFLFALNTLKSVRTRFFARLPSRDRL